jgi:hypothetical protein
MLGQRLNLKQHVVGADKNGMGGKMIYGPADIEGTYVIMRNCERVRRRDRRWRKKKQGKRKELGTEGRE